MSMTVVDPVEPERVLADDAIHASDPRGAGALHRTRPPITHPLQQRDQQALELDRRQDKGRSSTSCSNVARFCTRPPRSVPRGAAGCSAASARSGTAGAVASRVRSRKARYAGDKQTSGIGVISAGPPSAMDRCEEVVEFRIGQCQVFGQASQSPRCGQTVRTIRRCVVALIGLAGRGECGLRDTRPARHSPAARTA